MTLRSTELGDALRNWRNRLAPSAVGLPTYGRRRAAGLRREELASLAGLSVDYVTRLEQGRATNPSTQVLGALARSLQLSRDERDHLFALAGQAPPRSGVIDAHLTPGVQRLLARLEEFPVGVHDPAWTIVAWNALWEALVGAPRFAELWQSGTVSAHVAARKTFDHPSVGRITLDCDVMTVHGSDLRIVAYTAEPGSEDAQKLDLLRVVGTQQLSG